MYLTDILNVGMKNVMHMFCVFIIAANFRPTHMLNTSNA